MKVAIIDYGMGNLRSVANAFSRNHNSVDIINYPQKLKDADKIVLPGVGAFRDGMKNLKSGNWLDDLEEEVIHKGKPFLGICLGMQLLATTGSENGPCDGLNWIPGIVEQIKCNSQETRVPHIGWSDVQITIKGGIYAGLEKNQCFYFLHSYILTPVKSDVVSATCKHGIEFVASIEINNIYATQFHPEKSQKAGLAVIDNFLKI
jgi:glutamine amidotransferase